MGQNDGLYKQAFEAARKLFEDRTVEPEVAITNLETLKDEIDIFIDLLSNITNDVSQ